MKTIPVFQFTERAFICMYLYMHKLSYTKSYHRKNNRPSTADAGMLMFMTHKHQAKGVSI